MKNKIIITGTSGMVGEGVLIVCLDNTDVEEVLTVSRRKSDFKHPKLKELIVSDFSKIGDYSTQLSQYDACFFCAGVSSVGENEESFTKKTYDFVVPFAKAMSDSNSNMVFIYVSGSRTDSTEQGKVMWARVKGKTENAILKLPFKAAYNFRPGLMKQVNGQKNINSFYCIINWFYPAWLFFFPNFVCTLQEVGLAMIHCVTKGYSKSILEVQDIKEQAKL